MDETQRLAKLAELENIWREKFVREPKLPSEALMAGAVAMALGFGAVLFLLSPKMRPSAWIFIASSVACGLANRYFAHRWYTRTVLPWSAERLALKSKIDALRVPCSDSSGSTPGGSNPA